MPGRAAIRAEAERLRAHFAAAAGASVADAPVLLPAETLLDLYGEDIRARAYVTADPLRGEQMLRPDFTVPVALEHMAGPALPARYCYAGTVFRRQDSVPGRPSEYMQAGLEIFDRGDPASTDAEIFALFSDALAGRGLRAATGDMGILTAAVQGLRTSDRRRAALMRHIWRPRRFRELLERFSGRRPLPPRRRALIDALAAGKDLQADAGPHIGLRAPQEIAERLERLRSDAEEPPIAAAEAEILERVLRLRDKAPAALGRLRDLAVDLPAIAPAVERLADRLAVMESRGIATADLDFEATHGRTSLEYYDGFVFGFYAEGRPDLPPVATGGRYDALTRVLGGGRAMPAVGGMIRPATLLLLAAEETA